MRTYWFSMQLWSFKMIIRSYCTCSLQCHLIIGILIFINIIQVSRKFFIIYRALFYYFCFGIVWFCLNEIKTWPRVPLDFLPCLLLITNWAVRSNFTVYVQPSFTFPITFKARLYSKDFHCSQNKITKQRSKCAIYPKFSRTLLIL